MFTVKPDPGIVAKSFKADDQVFIGTEKLLPLSRFTNPGKPSGGGRGRYDFNCFSFDYKINIKFLMYACFFLSEVEAEEAEEVEVEEAGKLGLQ
jgi:hypothetical protein